MANQREQQRILVIAAHPDDEVLGCGGTLALHARRGEQVTVAIMCSGRPADEAATYAAQSAYSQAALRELGVHDVRLLGFPDQQLDTLPLTAVITALEQVVCDVQPCVVYAQHGGDINHDHSVLGQALLVATRPMLDHLEAVYAFDTASSTEWGYPRSFIPDTWVDISETLTAKLAAMACYKSELRPYPHPRSLEALRYRAHAWGNQCCLEAAEVFMTIRRITRRGETPV